MVSIAWVSHYLRYISMVYNDNFLEFTKSKGNDLSTPRDGFPGLKHGDHWCLCALRYKEAVENNHKMKVKKDATHIKTLKHVDNSQLN